MCERGIEDSKHVIMHRYLLYMMCKGLFRHLKIPGLEIKELEPNALLNLLLF